MCQSGREQVFSSGLDSPLTVSSQIMQIGPELKYTDGSFARYIYS